MAQAIFPPSGGFRIKYTRYTTAGAFTHTFDPNCAFYDRIIRGGGGSGSCSSNGGGGGGGASARIVHKNLKPLGATEAGTIGAGGAAVRHHGQGIQRAGACVLACGRGGVDAVHAGHRPSFRPGPGWHRLRHPLRCAQRGRGQQAKGALLFRGQLRDD